MLTELDDCIVLWRYIYIGGSPPETLGRGGCADALGLTTTIRLPRAVQRGNLKQASGAALEDP
jgi:hypothetical protein